MKNDVTAERLLQVAKQLTAITAELKAVVNAPKRTESKREREKKQQIASFLNKLNAK